MTTSIQEARALIHKEALIGSCINMLINAGTTAAKLSGKGPHILSVDSITNTQQTVLGQAVPMAVSLGFIGATINFFVFRRKARRRGLVAPLLLDRGYFPLGLREAVSSALAMLGLTVVVGVLWQRAVGSVTVSTPVAAGIAGLFAGIASYYSNRRVSTALLREW